MPAGARQFTELRLPGLGHCGLRGGRNGDLFVTIKVKEHERFRRVDEDVMKLGTCDDDLPYYYSPRSI